MRAFEKALVEAGNSQPDMLNADFYFDYGAAAEQAGQYVKASELFRKSIELDPDNAARSYNYLGYMWVERSENLEEAGQLIGARLSWTLAMARMSIAWAGSISSRENSRKP